jgi:hypothetical protein
MQFEWDQKGISRTKTSHSRGRRHIRYLAILWHLLSRWKRILTTGIRIAGRLIVVAHTDRDERIKG